MSATWGTAALRAVPPPSRWIRRRHAAVVGLTLALALTGYCGARIVESRRSLSAAESALARVGNGVPLPEALRLLGRDAWCHRVAFQGRDSSVHEFYYGSRRRGLTAGVRVLGHRFPPSPAETVVGAELLASGDSGTARGAPEKCGKTERAAP